MNARRYIIIVVSAVIIYPLLIIAFAFNAYTHPSESLGMGLFTSIGVLSTLFIGLVIFYFFKLRQITIRRLRAEHKTVLKEAIYRKMVEDSGIVTFVVNTDGTIRFVSKGLKQLTGYAPSEMKGKQLADAIAPSYKEDIRRLVSRVYTGDEIDRTIEVEICTRGNTDKWAACRIYAIRDENDDIQEVQVIVWDINEEKRLQLQLSEIEKENQRQYKVLTSVMDNVPAIIYLKYPDGSYAFINNYLKSLLSEEVRAKKVIVPGDVFEGNTERMRLYQAHDNWVMQHKQTAAYEDIYLNKQGQQQYFYVIKFPLLDENGDIEYIGGFSLDITALKEAQLKLHDALDEAKAAYEAQETFMANVSHDIRTPMNGILGLCNLLTTSTLLSPEQREYISYIEDAANNLLKLVNDLLDFSKVRSGKFQIEEIPFSFADTVHKSLYPLTLKATEKNIALEIEVDRDIPAALYGDPLRLQQILINLAGNALKFTEQGTVNIQASLSSRTTDNAIVKILVADTGIGIPADKLDAVFDSFAQSNTDIARQYGGTGLGLSIVKQLTELQNGTVTVKSKEGKGTTFTLELPYKLVKQPVAV